MQQEYGDENDAVNEHILLGDALAMNGLSIQQVCDELHSNPEN